jgi:hypothetical protein
MINSVYIFLVLLIVTLSIGESHVALKQKYISYNSFWKRHPYVVESIGWGTVIMWFVGPATALIFKKWYEEHALIILGSSFLLAIIAIIVVHYDNRSHYHGGPHDSSGYYSG